MRQEPPRKTETLELRAPEKLNATHDLSQFECGESSINEYLQKRALDAQQNKHAVVFVVCFKDTSIVAAYYTLSNASVARQYGATARLRRNTPDDLPVTVLGRMGVSRVLQGRGVAIALLADALEKSLLASEMVGSVALIVHPLTSELAGFYAKYGAFKPCPDLSPLTMMRSLR